MEVLDVTGLFEVFSVTSLNEQRRSEDSSPFKVILIAEKSEQIVDIGGLRLTPEFTFDNCPDLDLRVVPGGLGTRREVNNATIIKWISDRVSNTRLTASVFTGSSLLGKAGLLDNRKATTHWRSFDFLWESGPKTHILKDVQIYFGGIYFTSAGVAAGIDLSLYIVSHLLVIEMGQYTARYMEYPYPKDNF